MLFDLFKIEMRERYGHEKVDSDDEDEFENNVEDFEDSHENEILYACDECDFTGKSNPGLKTHKTVKHRQQDGK